MFICYDRINIRKTYFNSFLKFTVKGDCYDRNCSKNLFEEILDALEGYQKIAVVGCGGCAKVCLTGGSEQVEEFAGQLREEGKQVVLEATPERTCYVDKSHTKLDPYVDRLKQADAVIVMGCGGAVQITRQVTEELGLTIPVKTALDSVGHMDTLVSGELGSRIMAEKLKGHTVRKIFGAVLLIFVIKLFQKVIL